MAQETTFHTIDIQSNPDDDIPNGDTLPFVNIVSNSPSIQDMHEKSLDINGLINSPIPPRDPSLKTRDSTRDEQCLSVYSQHDGSRRPSALDILSIHGSEGAVVAVERARERRRIVIFMSWLSHIGVYVFPVLTVLCLLLYWVIPKKQEWLTMVAAGCGIMTIIAMIFFLYFNNRKEGRDLNDTFLRFRHVLSKRGARSRF